MCFSPFSLMKSDNSEEMNCGSLSDMICSGSPCAEKITLNTIIVLVTVAVDITKDSGYFECASTATKNIAPRNSPAKSM